MSFLGLYRDPVIAKVTGRSDWRIHDLVDGPQPISLYLVVPPSDIARTKPLMRLVLNQIGRRLTESLDTDKRRQKLLRCSMSSQPSAVSISSRASSPSWQATASAAF